LFQKKLAISICHQYQHDQLGKKKHYLKWNWIHLVYFIFYILHFTSKRCRREKQYVKKDNEETLTFWNFDPRMTQHIRQIIEINYSTEFLEDKPDVVCSTSVRCCNRDYKLR
jgi:hypothetical protein